MNLRDSIIIHADTYRLAAAALVAGILVVLFIFTAPVDAQQHDTLTHHFNQLQQDEDRLGEAVLRLNYGLSNNYDGVNVVMARMHATARALREGEAATELRTVGAFERQLRLLETRLASLNETLESFKSHNAVLKNSLSSLPYLRDQLLKDLPRGSAVRELAYALVEHALINRIDSTSSERNRPQTSIAALQKEAAKLPAELRQNVTTLLNRARLIDRYEREMQGFVRQLTGQHSNSALADAYLAYFDRQQARAFAFRFFMLLTTLLLLAYAVLALYRMSQQSRQLKLASSVFASASEGIIITDVNGTILDVNDPFTAITGYSREEMIGKNPCKLNSGRHDAQFYAQMWQSIKDTGSWQGEIWNRRKNGEIYPEWLTITAGKVLQGDAQRVTHYIGAFTDITRRMKSAAGIFQLAFFDSITHLPNRRLLMERLHRALAARDTHAGHIALMFIDLDNFKTLNDTQGHHVGDRFLIDVAQRLRASTCEGDTVARLGGDEFVVLMEGLSAEPDQAAIQAQTVGEKLLQALNRPYRLNDFEYHSSCSIGVRLSSQDASADELLKQADTAMYEAKAAGRNALRFFDPAMQAALEARAALEVDLRQALAQQQFVLYFQAQVDADGRPQGAEALLRWNHPQRGLVPPGDFIPLAEEIGLILPIGLWVLETACAQLKAWESRPETRHLTLAVNVSARQFAAEGFVDQVKSIILHSGIDPARLKLEITESMLLDNAERDIRTMRQIKALGVGFSLDDFGTGYSSLQYLKHLPLDQIKIDRSFVRELASSPSDQTIARTIIAMARSMELDVIAEGVETEAQRQCLLEAGCASFQGYFFSKPVPLEPFEAMLKPA